MKRTELDWVGECHDNPMFAAEHIVKLEQQLSTLREAAQRVVDSNKYAGDEVEVLYAALEVDDVN